MPTRNKSSRIARKGATTSEQIFIREDKGVCEVVEVVDVRSAEFPGVGEAVFAWSMGSVDVFTYISMLLLLSFLPILT